MSREWGHLRDQLEKAQFTDAQFISQLEVIEAHYDAVAREMTRGDFRGAWRSIPTSRETNSDSRVGQEQFN